MKISKSRLKEIIKEEIKHVLKEEDYDTLRDKYGKDPSRWPAGTVRRGRRSRSKQPSVPVTKRMYLDISDSEAKKLERKYDIYHDRQKGAWWYAVGDAPYMTSVPKELADKMDTKTTDSKLQTRVKSMKKT